MAWDTVLRRIAVNAVIKIRLLWRWEISWQVKWLLNHHPADIHHKIENQTDALEQKQTPTQRY
jgi:hypothetical protein